MYATRPSPVARKSTRSSLNAARSAFRWANSPRSPSDAASERDARARPPVERARPLPVEVLHVVEELKPDETEAPAGIARAVRHRGIVERRAHRILGAADDVQQRVPGGGRGLVDDRVLGRADVEEGVGADTGEQRAGAPVRRTGTGRRNAATPRAATNAATPSVKSPRLPRPVPSRSAQVPATTVTCAHWARRAAGSAGGWSRSTVARNTTSAGPANSARRWFPTDSASRYTASSRRRGERRSRQRSASQATSAIVSVATA